jgi:hypothetical protein
MPNKCGAEADSPLLNLMFLMCSLYLVKFRSVCSVYTLRHLWQVILYLLLCSYIFVVLCVPRVVVVLNTIFKLASLNNFVILRIYSPVQVNVTHFCSGFMLLPSLFCCFSQLCKFNIIDTQTTNTYGAQGHTPC